jgi:hypothetical protein
MAMKIGDYRSVVAQLSLEEIDPVAAGRPV